MLMLAPSVALILTSVATTIWATAKVVWFVVDAVRGLKDTILLAVLLDAIDTYLIATVIMVLGLGLSEAFGGVRGPGDELVRAGVLTKLEVNVADVLVLVLAVRFVEELLTSGAARDLLFTAAAIGIVSLALVLFIRISEGT